MRKYIIRKIPMVIAIAATGVLLFSGLFMLLWNSVLPAVLHVSAITIWQAAGILLLSKILFGGARGRNRMWHGNKRRMAWQQDNSRPGQDKNWYYRHTERP